MQVQQQLPQLLPQLQPQAPEQLAQSEISKRLIEANKAAAAALLRDISTTVVRRVINV